MSFVENDFEYYRRTIAIMYKKYYLKRLLIVGAAAGIIGIYTAVMQQNLILNVLLIMVLLGLMAYLLQQRGKFEPLYEQFRQANEPPVIHKIEEDEYSYRVLGTEGPLRINKNGVRNLPSNNKQYTLMVGFEKNLFAKQPLQLTYYDMLDLTYEEKFRLKRNGYQSLPRFLRRFTPGNIKASAGNLFQFALGNIFALFLLFRLVSYLISMFRSFF